MKERKSYFLLWNKNCSFCLFTLVFIYNFAMEDYGTVKTESIVDIMKVMSFAMKQGKVRVEFLSNSLVHIND